MGRKQKKYHYIYKTTCGVNGKYYIGMHSTDKMGDGYLGSGKRLWNSIKYHGKENFIKEILEYCETREELKKREEEIVNEQLLTEDLCMNLKTGGQGGFIDENHRIKLRDGASRYQTEMWKDEEYVRNFVEASTKAVKLRHKEGKMPPPPNWLGKVHKEETKKKMSEKAKLKTGKKNSQYGTCWITKDGENKKIKKEDLSTHTNNGWVKGRK